MITKIDNDDYTEIIDDDDDDDEGIHRPSSPADIEDAVWRTSVGQEEEEASQDRWHDMDQLHLISYNITL